MTTCHGSFTRDPFLSETLDFFVSWNQDHLQNSPLVRPSTTFSFSVMSHPRVTRSSNSRNPVVNEPVDGVDEAIDRGTKADLKRSRYVLRRSCDMCSSYPQRRCFGSRRGGSANQKGVVRLTCFIFLLLPLTLFSTNSVVADVTTPAQADNPAVPVLQSGHAQGVQDGANASVPSA